MVILDAISKEQPISDALLVNAIAGTVGSYKTFYRKAKAAGKIPTTNLSYYLPEISLLAAAIRTATGNAYPVTSDLTVIDLKPIYTVEEEIQEIEGIPTVVEIKVISPNYLIFLGQEQKDYNITTNKLTHDGFTWDVTDYEKVDHFDELEWKYRVDISRGKQITTHTHIETTTTTTTTVNNFKKYYVYYGGTPALWRVLEENWTNNTVTVSEEVVTTTTVTYVPYEAPVVTVNTVTNSLPGSSTPDTFIDSITYEYDLVNDPAELNLCDPATETCTTEQLATITVCNVSGLEYLCDYVTTITPVVVVTESESTVVEDTTVEDSIFIYGPALQLIDIYYEPTTLDAIEIPALYWQVRYTYLGRTYIWIGAEKDYGNLVGEETDLVIFGNSTFEFSPVITLRKDLVTYTDPSPEHAEAKKLLKLIAIDPDVVMEAITNPPETDPPGGAPPPDMNHVNDVYITLKASLNSTHMEELAYVYQFFKELKDVSVPVGASEDLTWNFEGLGHPYNRLTAKFGGEYHHTIKWVGISESVITGTLPSLYTKSISVNDVSLLNEPPSITYTIRKRIVPTDPLIPPTEYSEIIVTKLQVEYVITYGPEEGKAFTVDPSVNTEEDPSHDQLVIPVSLTIAKKVLKRDLETFFLRTTYVGMYSRQVVKFKWYQAGFFKFLLIVILVYLAITSLSPELIIQAEAAIFAITGAAVGVNVAIIVALIALSVTAWALRGLLIRAISSTSGFLQDLLKVVYVVASIAVAAYGGGYGLYSVNSVFAGLDAYSNIQLQEAAQLEKEFNEIVKDIESINKITKELSSEDKADKFAASLSRHNLFTDGGNIPLTEEELAWVQLQPNYYVDTTYSYFDLVLELPDPATLMDQTDALLES
jgi:hypothetical protein